MSSNHYTHPWRNMIYSEQAKVLANANFDGNQFILRLHAPRIAKAAEAGQFVHIQVSNHRPMRRPISIMMAHNDGKLDLMIKAVGAGTRLLQKAKSGESLSLLGPIGRPFDLTNQEKRYVLIGGGVGTPPMLSVAKSLADSTNTADVVLFVGTECKFPLALRPSSFMLAGIVGNTILALDCAEEWGVPSRLASNAGFYGHFAGHVPDLAAQYLQALDADELTRCELLSCGPKPMLHAVAKLARRFNLQAQLSLEENMACGIGGCAACVVQTNESGTIHYRRICVDGPVFPANVLPMFAS
ncbi:MAG: dihydroorotate dehydrogenase electron transfer subunit [Mariprofundales bacterium]